MSEFLRILKEKLSDRRYGWYEYRPPVVKSRRSVRAPRYGHEEEYEEYLKARKENYGN